MPKFTPEQQGLKQKLLMDKLKAKLDETQSEGKERILFLAETLVEELRNQGYSIKEESQLIPIWIFQNELSVQINNNDIRRK